MHRNPWVVAALAAVLIGLSGCNREQSAWEKARAANTAASYDQFVKDYPNGAFTAQARAQLKELNEDRDWQAARDADTQEAYRTFLTNHPDGKWSEEARIRIENFTLAQPPSGAPAASAAVGGSPAAAAANPPPSRAAAPAAEPEPATAPAARPAEKPARPAPKARESAATRGAPRGGYAVQLGAYKSGPAAADKRWRALRARYGSVLHGLKPRVRATKTSSGRVYRLQLEGLSAARAHAICKRLKANAQPCIVLPPARHRARR